MSKIELNIFSDKKACTEAEVFDNIRRQVEHHIEAYPWMEQKDLKPVLTMNALRIIWGHLREKYNTRYKMSNDVLDISTLAAEIEALDGFDGEVIIDMPQRIMTVCFPKRIWYIKWRGYLGYQTINVSPFRQQPTGTTPLCSTYKIPKMLLEADFMLDEIEHMIEQLIIKNRKKRLQLKINRSTAKALVKEALGNVCEYRLYFRGEGGRVDLVFDGNPRLSMNFSFEQMHEKIPLMTEIAKGMICLWTEFNED